MKIIRLIITIVVIIASFGLTVSADSDPNQYINDFDNIVPEEYKDLWGDTSVTLIGPDAVLYELTSAFRSSVGRVGSLFLLLLGGLAIGGAAQSVTGKLSDSVGVGTSVVIISASLGISISVIEEVRSALSLMQSFFAAFIPIATAVSCSSGAVSTAAAQAMGMNVTLSLLGLLTEPFFTVIAGFGMTVALITSFGDGSLSSFGAGVKRFFLWVIGLAGVLIMGMMSLQSFVAGARDSARMRAAKYAAGSLIPVVGNTVSGALGTLVGGLSYAKSMIGAGGVVITTAIVLSPLVMLLLYRTAVSVLASLGSYIGASGISRAYGALREAFDLFISVYAVAAILCVFEIALFAVSGGFNI